MDKNKIGMNLRKFRLAKGLSQKDVAADAKISYVAYSNIERGLSFPKDDTLEKLAKTLEVSVSDIWQRSDSLDNIRFRAGSKMISRDRVLVDIETRLKNREFIEELLREQPDKRTFLEVAEEIRSLIFKIEDKNQAAREAAQILRARWNLGIAPLPAITILLESHGIKILHYPIQSEHFFGLSIGHNGGGPVIVVNTWEEIPVERWIFTVAHELGHLILHHRSYDVCVKDEDDVEEKQANSFASAFLMPHAAYVNEWNKYCSLGLGQLILTMKRNFMVSWKTIVYRYEEISGNKKIWGMATAALKSYGLTVHGKIEPKPLEPLDFWGDVRAGVVMEDYVYRALRSNLIDEAKAMDLLAFKKQEFEKFIADFNSRIVCDAPRSPVDSLGPAF